MAQKYAKNFYLPVITDIFILISKEYLWNKITTFFSILTNTIINIAMYHNCLNIHILLLTTKTLPKMHYRVNIINSFLTTIMYKLHCIHFQLWCIQLNYRGVSKWIKYNTLCLFIIFSRGHIVYVWTNIFLIDINNINHFILKINFY